jgi:hypothetical protein
MRNNLFKKINNNFIETGCYHGNGIQLALDSGFEKVYSIEITEHYSNLCRRRFQSLGDKVELIQGDSFFKLKELLDSKPNNRFTYWLDGHHSGGDTGFGVKRFPIMEELEAILSREVTGEIIYIDDMRVLKNLTQFHSDEDINLEKILNLVNKLKPGCKIWFEATPYDTEDNLVIEY